MSTTHPFQHMLLATEHGEFDNGAERVAFALAGRHGLPLAAVLPVASNPEYEAVAPQLAARADAQAAERLQALQAAAAAAGVELRCRVRHGAELDREIVDEAREQGSDLIVVRRRGPRAFLARLLLGEMVSRVVATAPCSVLVVPRAAGLWARAVLLALDPQAGADQHAALTGTALAMAAGCALPLGVVCVADGDAALRARADATAQAALDAARAHQVPASSDVRVGKPFEQIIAAADALGADLIVMGRHGGALPGRAWLGGTAQKVIGLAERPVLVSSPTGTKA